MPRSGTTNQIALEEKGQRTARSLSPYLPKGGLKEPAVCRKCGLQYRGKRWVLQHQEIGRPGSTTVCPACLRMADNNPAGIIKLKGPYLLAHEDDILNLIKKTEASSREKNPLGRIMEINQEHDQITILTTEDKLAQKIGRQIYKAHRGALDYQWNQEEELVRVNWTR